MNSPNIITVRRIRRKGRCRSIRDVSRNYFRTEDVHFLLVESILFLILAAVAIWPIVDAVEAVRNSLL